MIRAVAIIALLGAAIGPARADDPDPAVPRVGLVTTTPPTAALRATAVAFAGDTSLTRAVATAAAIARTGAASACFAKREVTRAVALVLVVVDKKGKTTRITAGGTGDAALDRCLEKAIKPVRWATTPAGGAIVLEIKVSSVLDVGDLGAKLDAIKGAEETERTRVEVGAVTGGAASYAESAMKVIRARRHVLVACYERALLNDPSLGGAIEIRIKVGVDGRVASVALTKGLAPDFDACVARQMSAYRFPAPDAVVELVIPLTVDSP